MKSLQEIRIDVVRMGKEIKVNPIFEKKFRELNDYLMKKFGCTDFKLEEFELDKVDNSNFESCILKFAICKAFGIPVYSGVNNPWFRCFNVVRTEEPLSYHGSMSDIISTKYDLVLSGTVGYEVYDLISISDEQIEFIRGFKNRYNVLKENLLAIKADCFPIEVTSR